MANRRGALKCPKYIKFLVLYNTLTIEFWRLTNFIIYLYYLLCIQTKYSKELTEDVSHVTDEEKQHLALALDT